jgi:hypothetical protein
MPSERERITKLVEDAASSLSEHCDSVRIFVTRYACDDESGTTISFDAGRGNLHAQLGQIYEWIDIQRQYQRNWAIRQDEKDN